ncbi:hypothetical protein [Hugenholtzia roseola]|uniref:hypothetical protein n=1 Tax=Hugenholtzia roseola TaxID=1002 RepID=UPI0012B55094|nr:hypothetical protein [Hugenholtzia roseola]
MHVHTPESPYQLNQKQELQLQKKQREERKKERVIALLFFLTLLAVVIAYLHLAEEPKQEYVILSASSIALGQDVPYQEQAQPNTASQESTPTETSPSQEEPIQTQDESEQVVAENDAPQAEPQKQEPKKEPKKEEPTKQEPKKEEPKKEEKKEKENPNQEPQKQEPQKEEKKQQEAATPAGKPEGETEKKPDDSQLEGDKPSKGSGGDEISMEGEQIWAGFDRGNMRADASKQNGILKYQITVDATGRIIEAQFSPRGSSRVSLDIQNHYRAEMLRAGRMKLIEGKTPKQDTYKGVLTIVLKR